MTEHEKETAFLRHLIQMDETNQCRKLDDAITKLQRDQRCVQRAVSLLSLFALFALVFFSYGTALVENFPSGTISSVARVITELGLACVIAIASLAGLQMIYRKRMNRLREECRRLIMKILQSRLDTPPFARAPKPAEALQQRDTPPRTLYLSHQQDQTLVKEQ
jgi:hypothetical protein